MTEELGISFEALLRYQEQETERWCQFFTKRPFMLNIEASPSQTVGDVIFHAFSSECRVAQRLLGEPMTPDAEFHRATVEELFDMSRMAREKFREFLQQTHATELVTVELYPSPTLGEFRASPRKLLTHALVHSIRHWAQLASVLREHGQRADWSHDVLFSKALE